MTLRLVATKRARRDILELLAYIAADNPTAARSMQARIDKTLRLLAQRPFIGPTAGFKEASLRRFSIPPYVIFYRPQREMLAVVRVIHSSMDISRQRITDDSA